MTDEIFIKSYRLIGDDKVAPTYGNFCPRCKVESDEVKVYDAGLLICTRCNYCFTIEDVEQKINIFWVRKEC